MKAILERIKGWLGRRQQTQVAPPHRRSVQELDASAQQDIRRVAEELKALGVSVRAVPERDESA